MPVILLDTNRPVAFGTGKPAQCGFQPVINKLQDGRPLSVSVTERSWLLFERALPYLHLTRPVGDKPHVPTAPILFPDKLAWLR